MNKKTKMVGSSLLLFGIALGLAVQPLVGKVFADVTIPQVYACVKDNGLTRIQLTKTTCGTGETLLVWNTQGAQGPQGPQGVPGPAGHDGGIGTLEPEWFKNSLITWNDFRFRNWDGVDFSGSAFIDIYLGEADFRNTDFSNSFYASGKTVYKVNGDFSGANFTGAKFMSTNNATTYYKANYSNANFTNADMHDTLMETYFGNTLSGSGKTDFTQSNFSGAIWSNTKCPDNTNSDYNGGTCEGHLVAF